MKRLEQELVKELNDTKKNLAHQVEQTEQEKRNAQMTMNTRVEEIKKVSDDEKKKMEQLVRYFFYCIFFTVTVYNRYFIKILKLTAMSPSDQL